MSTNFAASASCRLRRYRPGVISNGRAGVCASPEMVKVSAGPAFEKKAHSPGSSVKFGDHAPSLNPAYWSNMPVGRLSFEIVEPLGTLGKMALRVLPHGWSQ